MSERLSAVLLAALILLAPIAGAAGSAVAATPTSTSSSTPASLAPSGGSLASVTSSSTVSQAERPDGQVTLPDSNVGPPDHANVQGQGPPGLQAPSPRSNMPTSASAWQVHASDHAGDLIVEVGQTPDGDVALGFTDDTNHDGRAVAVNASTLIEQVGRKPKMAYGLHEDGSTWRSPISYEDGYATWRIPEFSSNTVEFSGEFVLKSDPSFDGDTHQYEAEGGENLSVTVTGNTSKAWDNETAVNVLAGNSDSVSIGGTVPPEGPASGSPELTITAEGERTGMASSYSNGRIGLGEFNSNHYSYEAHISNPPSTITKVDLLVNSNDGGVVFDVYIVEEGVDAVFGEGTKVASGVSVSGSGTKTIDISDYSPSGSDVTVEFVYDSSASTGGNAMSIAENRDPSTAHMATSQDGTLNNYGGVELVAPKPSSVDVESDDGTVASFTGLGTDATQTQAFNISESTGSLTFNASKGQFDYQLDLKEVTKTEDPTICLNENNGGECSTHAGTLNDGESASLSIADSAIVNGTNKVNVSLAPVSNDAPTQAVALDYRHDVVESKSIEFKSEAFAERYNVSKTWADDTKNAQLNITWASGNVITVRDVVVEYRNSTGDLQSTDTSPKYSTQNGTLTVELGDVPAGWETRVKASGGKVQVHNGSIKVLDPTNAGDDLNTKIEITSKSSGFRIDVSGLTNRVHYLTKKSWTGTPYTTHDANGQQTIYMPDASTGSTTRIRTMPLTVNPGDQIEVVVEKPAEPRFRLRKGASDGSSDVMVLWHDTVSGETYRLYDETNGREVMQDKAESPVEFSTSGDALTYTISLVEGGTAVAVDSSGEFGEEESSSSSSPVGMIVLLLSFVASIGGVLFLGRRWLGLDGVRAHVGMLLAGLVVGDVAAYALVGRSLTASFFAFVAGGLTTAGGGAFAAFVESGALPVVVGFALLLGVFAVESSTGFNLPRWLWIVGGGLVVIWVLDSLANGGLTDALQTLGPLLWLLLIGGGIVLLWRALQPTIVQVGGTS